MVVRAPDPHNLRRLTGAVPAPIIEVDRPCLGCGYNLRGLRAGITCPECGMPSVMPEGIDDPLAMMPRRIILAFVWGCWAASFCAVGVITAVVAKRFPAIDARIPALALAGLSVLWVLATWLLTPAFAIPQAVFRGFSRASRIRRLGRLLQWGWVLTGVCNALEVFLPAAGAGVNSMLSIGSWLGMTTGLAGVIVLCVLMERLADWARDEDAQTMFNWTMWALPAATLLLFVNVPLPLVGALFVLLWLIAVGMFPWGLLSLSKSVTLSIVHSFEHDERTRRRQERTQTYHDHVGRLVEKMDGRNDQPR